jgi:hypothetical protein
MRPNTSLIAAVRDEDTHRNSAHERVPSREELSGNEFLEGLRKVVGFRAYPDAPDPLVQIVERIVKQPAVAESRLLLRALVALVGSGGKFRRAELAALDAPTVALVIRLMDLRSAGTRTDQDWADAIAAAEAAAA